MSKRRDYNYELKQLLDEGIVTSFDCRAFTGNSISGRFPLGYTMSLSIADPEFGVIVNTEFRIYGTMLRSAETVVRFVKKRFKSLCK